MIFFTEMHAMISIRLITAALILLTGLLLAGCSRAGPVSADTNGAADDVSQSGTTSQARSRIGFASHQRLVEHYQKHGSEFGTITMQEYLRRAQELRDRSAGGDVLEIVRADHVITRFERSSGSFIAFNPDGIIRTYFRPNDGENYFRRQGQRGD
jgi:pyocin large subunit-like protein